MKFIFTRSERFTMGTELELQLLEQHHALLANKADIVLASTGNDHQIKHELTNSMIEINSAPHTSIAALHTELVRLAMKVRQTACNHGCDIAGGGRHLTANWHEQTISGSQRYQALAQQYGFITKMACVFGQHIHVGVNDGDEAIYLCHALIPWLPHLVALSASSPWLDGEDTHFASSRFTGQNSFLNSGLPERVYNWKEFTAFYHELHDAGIIKSIKDIYWYIRPQPALGTVEIRICDMPLTLSHATMLTGYTKQLIRFLLKDRKSIIRKHHAVEQYNIFNARRDGLRASYITIPCGVRLPLSEHILQVIDILTASVEEEEDDFVLNYIRQYVHKGINDSDRIRQMIKNTLDLHTVAEQMAKILFHVPKDYPHLHTG